jgi:hypothetical protein
MQAGAAAVQPFNSSIAVDFIVEINAAAGRSVMLWSELAGKGHHGGTQFAMSELPVV